MGKHIKIDQVWIENRFRTRRRMTGGKLYLDPATGFKATVTTHGFTVEKKLTFLERFQHCSNINQICKSLGINIQTFYDHLAMDEVFRQEFITLDDIPDKILKLNDALLNITKEREAAFISDLLQKTDRYQ